MVNITDALAAYRNAASAKPLGGGSEDSVAPGESFSTMLKDVAGSAIQKGKDSEKLAVAAVAGKADLTEVVTAINSAETTLQTVVAVRDKVITAYQDILRMPI